MGKLDIKSGDKWWVIVLKAIAYIIGLILGGIGTVQAATMLAMV